MQDLIDKGYVESLDSDTNAVGGTWYLPHHPGFHSKKPGKMRVVFDCDEKKNGTSVNDRVLQAPGLTNILFGRLTAIPIGANRSNG